MPDETDTTILRRGGSAVAKHGGKVFGGATAGTIIFLYTYFTPLNVFNKHCDDCARAHSENWQLTMDHALELERLKMRQELRNAGQEVTPAPHHATN